MKLSIIGTGFIVPIALEALAQIKEIEVTSIYAREHSKDKGEDIAKRFHIPKVYIDYEQLLREDDCDFVYIANLNPVHYEFAKLAFKYNKNVIMEKPICVNADQLKDLARISKENRLYLMEAITPLHLPNYFYIKENINKVGNIKTVQCNYSQFSSRYNRYKQGIVLPQLDPQFYGGALYDINIYNVSVIIGLFGKPKNVTYYVNQGFNGIDLSGTIILQYDDFNAFLTGAKDSESPGHITIQGDEGYFKVNSTANEFRDFDYFNNQTVKHYNFNEYEHRMVHEFVDFEHIYNTNNYEQMSNNLETSIQVMEVVDEAINSAHLKFGIQKER